jgi:hypothetical protein
LFRLIKYGYSSAASGELVADSSVVARVGSVEPACHLDVASGVSFLF